MDSIKAYLKVKHLQPDTARGRYFALVNFTETADKHRFFIFDTQTDELVYSWWTSHGSGSGPITGQFLVFSNRPDSRQSSVGLMKVGELYTGKYGRSRRLYGLEKGVNDNVFKRAIVVHSSDYVRASFVKGNKYPGRSWGCVTLRPEDKENILTKYLTEGTHLYIFSDRDL